MESDNTAKRELSIEGNDESLDGRSINTVDPSRATLEAILKGIGMDESDRFLAMVDRLRTPSGG